MGGIDKYNQQNTTNYYFDEGRLVLSIKFDILTKYDRTTARYVRRAILYRGKIIVRFIETRVH